MNLRLIRIIEKEDATLGVLLIEEVPRLVTLELPWRFNQTDVSCIPVGRYKMNRIQSPKFGETFEVANVPDRGNIEFHWGNTYHDTEGCILLGNQFGITYAASHIIDSKNAFEAFLRFIGSVDEADLTIQANYSSAATAL